MFFIYMICDALGLVWDVGKVLCFLAFLKKLEISKSHGGSHQQKLHLSAIVITITIIIQNIYIRFVLSMLNNLLSIYV